MDVNSHTAGNTASHSSGMAPSADAKATLPQDRSISERVAQKLSEPRMNRSLLLPECMCLQPPRVVSYSDVGDPEGLVAFLILGVDCHRYMAFLFDEAARARGVRLICIDRPDRGHTSGYVDEGANRVLEFPEVMRAFCKVARIKAFALLGQSLGATYALRCAQEMPDMIATTVYLISPWVPLSVPGSNRALAFAERLPSWLIEGAMKMGTAMPRLLASAGGLKFMAKVCSEAEAELFAADTTAEVLKAVVKNSEATHGIILDTLAALEKKQPLGFDYRDVSMPVHVFHGRADKMVPFAAAQWMAEEMPACTVSVKMGGTHALVMDTSVMDCVLECMCEDFKHYQAHAADGRRSLPDFSKGAAFSFPAHTQRFQAEGHLLCLCGMLLKDWEPRYFILEGYQLHEFKGSDRAAARRVVDLRGSVARVPMEGGETRANHLHDRIFEFRLEDSKHKCLYDMAARTAGERAFWVETLTKASRFTKGSGEEQRQGALTKRFLVTKRPESRRGIGLKEVGSAEADIGAEGHTEDLGSLISRRASLPAGGSSAHSTGTSRSPRIAGHGAGASALSSLPEQDTSSPTPMIMSRKPWHRLNMARSQTPGDVKQRRKVAKESLHGTPLRRRSSLSYDEEGMTPKNSETIIATARCNGHHCSQAGDYGNRDVLRGQESGRALLDPGLGDVESQGLTAKSWHGFPLQLSE